MKTPLFSMYFGEYAAERKNYSLSEFARDEWLIKMRTIYGTLSDEELVKGFRYDYKNALIEYTDKGKTVIINPVGKDSYEITKEFFNELIDY